MGLWLCVVWRVALIRRWKARCERSDALAGALLSFAPAMACGAEGDEVRGMVCAALIAWDDVMGG